MKNGDEIRNSQFGTSDHYQYTAPDGKAWRAEACADLCADYDLAQAGAGVAPLSGMTTS